MNAFNSADVLPKRVGVPNMIPSAHSASAGVGIPYSASILLLRSSHPGTLAITAGRDDIGHPAESDFGSGLMGSVTDGFSQCFYGAVPRVKDNEDVYFNVRHRQLLEVDATLLKRRA